VVCRVWSRKKNSRSFVNKDEGQDPLGGYCAGKGGGSIPPIMIINRIYENQNLLYIVPLTRRTIVVCISSISPMVIGCFICVNISLVIVLIQVILLC